MGLCISPALTPNQQRLYTLAMASEEYKGFHISAWSRPEYGKDSASVGIVCKATRMGSIVEVKRIEGRSFESKEEAELHGLELCKEWIDKQGSRSFASVEPALSAVEKMKMRTLVFAL
jgi:hypothetical protein